MKTDDLFMIVWLDTRNGSRVPGVPVVAGDWVFALMDREGLPLPIINMLLAEQGWTFDKLQFCRAAKESGNHSPERVRRLLRGDIYPRPDALVVATILRAWA